VSIIVLSLACPRAAAAEETPARAGERESSVVLGAGGHLAFGAARAVAVGVVAAAEVVSGRWSFGLEGRYDLPASADTTQGARVRATLEGGSLVPCLRVRVMRACPVIFAARAETIGADLGGPTFHNASFFLGLGGRLGMDAPLPLDFALRIGGEILVHPISYELDAPDGHRLYKSNGVSVAIGPTLVRTF
jgi:hypothetical protein